MRWERPLSAKGKEAGQSLWCRGTAAAAAFLSLSLGVLRASSMSATWGSSSRSRLAARAGLREGVGQAREPPKVPWSQGRLVLLSPSEGRVSRPPPLVWVGGGAAGVQACGRRSAVGPQRPFLRAPLPLGSDQPGLPFGGDTCGRGFLATGCVLGRPPSPATAAACQGRKGSGAGSEQSTRSQGAVGAAAELGSRVAKTRRSRCVRWERPLSAKGKEAGHSLWWAQVPNLWPGALGTAPRSFPTTRGAQPKPEVFPASPGVLHRRCTPAVGGPLSSAGNNENESEERTPRTPNPVPISPGRFPWQLIVNKNASTRGLPSGSVVAVLLVARKLPPKPLLLRRTNLFTPSRCFSSAVGLVSQSLGSCSECIEELPLNGTAKAVGSCLWNVGERLALMTRCCSAGRSSALPSNRPIFSFWSSGIHCPSALCGLTLVLVTCGSKASSSSATLPIPSSKIPG